MNSWEKLPIGELFSLEKGSLQSTKCTPGDYTFITASSEWKTHNEYSHDCEALVYAVAASGSLGRCHHYSGKFISSDLCFILRAKDEKKRPINYRFYQNVFRFLKDDIVAKTKAGTSKESISQKRLSAYTLPYIDIEHQSYWENKLNNLNDKIENFEVESTSQSTYLTKLRLAILQEAIEGKLTAGWRKENPGRKGDPDYDAEALLEKIQAEKEKLIKEGEIKKQKQLAPIKADEVPFELPEGWVWTRVADFSKQYVDCPHDTPQYIEAGYPCLRAPDVTESGVILDNVRYVSESEYINRISRLKPEENDIVYIREGGRLGIAGVIKTEKAVCLGQRVMLLRCFNKYSSQYLSLFLNAPNTFKEIVGKTIGAASPHVNVRDIIAHVLPLPPFAEQQTIINRVEKLLSMVDELEKQVSERKEQSEQLMQAVLREAFEGKA